MKKIKYLVLAVTLFFSCKKEKQYKPDENITYTHWYKTRTGSLDTLFSVYIPNAFTTRADGKNDSFIPKGEFTGNYYNLKVFDRGGSVIFNTNDRNLGWDGRMVNNGNYVLSGTYVYKLKISDAMDNQYEYNGSVIALR